MGEQPGIRLEHLSGPYRTEPVGMVSQNRFINAAGSISTSLEPRELLHILLAVEKEFGRTRDPLSTEYRDRILDFDLLLYADQILSSRDLVLPHPELQNRLFVLYPLSEITPDYMHPLLQRTVQDLLRELQEKQGHQDVEKAAWPEDR